MKLVNFLFEVDSLRYIIRSHCQVIPADDSVAEHSFCVTIIGTFLAFLEKVDPFKTMMMCLFHDVVEARTGDANFLHQQYSTQFEEKARQDQLKDLPSGQEILTLLKEFEEQKTREAKVAKDADRLHQMLLEQKYLQNPHKEIWQGNKWRKLQTASAKKLAELLKTTDPMEWLYQVIEEKKGDTIKR